jgi:hypothetical protein
MIEQHFPGMADVVLVSSSSWTERLRLDVPDIVLATYPFIEAKKLESEPGMEKFEAEINRRKRIARLKQRASVGRPAAVAAWILKNPSTQLRASWNISHNT